MMSDEYAYVAPDPLDPDIIYGGRVVRFDRRTGQAQSVAPEALRSGEVRVLRTMPLLFHPQDPTMLLFATNVLWKTHNGGRSWEIISPDLSRERPELPESIGDYRTPELESMPRRGVIYALGPSPLELGTIWAGTDDGLVHLTRDGGTTWRDVTPPALRSWDKVSQIDAGHFDAATAYLAINAIRRDDMRPHVYRTHDGGERWERVVEGLPENGPVNVVREDPKQPDLLFAGTERSVYFSIDDGASWQPLRQNLPPSSIRDLVVHDDDLVVGSHGRSIWILDNIAPLRELARASAAPGPWLFAPPPATRVRWNMFSDTPLPPEEPTGENPPDGAILDYLLPGSRGPVTLEIFAPDGDLVRRFSSEDPPERVDPSTLPHPTYWIRPPQRVSTEAGHHRFVWDLRYPPPRGARRQFSIAAVLWRTPSGPHGPFVPPGTYRVRLTQAAESVERSLEVRLDPRVRIDSESLELQTTLSRRCYDAYHRAQRIREAIDPLLGDASGLDQSRAETLRALRGAGDPGDPDILYGSIYATPAGEESATHLQHKLLFLLNVLQGADARPTRQAEQALLALELSLASLEERWHAWQDSQ